MANVISSYTDYAIGLGGVYTGLEWHDLSPHELMLSCAGTTIKAGKVALLAAEQAEAAAEFGLKDQETAYLATAHFLFQMAARVN